MEVLCREERQLTREEAAEFYKQHEGSVSWAGWPGGREGHTPFPKL